MVKLLAFAGLLIAALTIVAAFWVGLYLLLVYLGAPKWVALTIVLVISFMPGVWTEGRPY